MLYEVPARGRKNLTVSCLRQWLQLCLNHGKEGLLPHRDPTAAPRSLSAAEAALLLNYLEGHPGFSCQLGRSSYPAEQAELLSRSFRFFAVALGTDRGDGTPQPYTPEVSRSRT